MEKFAESMPAFLWAGSWARQKGSRLSHVTLA